jgi:hypothetical protein
MLLAQISCGLLCVKQALPRLKVVQEWHPPFEAAPASVRSGESEDVTVVSLVNRRSAQGSKRRWAYS